MITAPLPAFPGRSAALRCALTLGPTPAQIAAAEAGLPQGSALPASVYYIYSYQQQNALNLKSDGIDFDFSYTFDLGGNTFLADLAGSRKLKMKQQFGA